MHRTEGANNVANLFTNGPPGTTLEENWLNAVQEEIIAVLTAAGISPLTAKTDTKDQLVASIQSLITGIFDSDLSTLSLPANVTISNFIKTLLDDASAAAAVATLGAVRLNTGQYTGDGTASRAITGVGFRPRYVKITQRRVTNSIIEIYEKTDQDYETMCAGYTSVADHGCYAFVDRLISLDADGFTIGDAGENKHPNGDGNTYRWMALS